MPKDLGKKHTCYSCQAKFYDLGKPQALCPKCGANQKDAEDAHPAPSSRSRRAPVIEVPVIEDELEDQPEVVEEEDETLVAEEAAPEEEAEDDDDDEEEYDE